MPVLDSSYWKHEVEISGRAKPSFHHEDQKAKDCNAVKTNSWRRTFPDREVKPVNH